MSWIDGYKNFVEGKRTPLIETENSKVNVGVWHEGNEAKPPKEKVNAKKPSRPKPVRNVQVTRQQVKQAKEKRTRWSNESEVGMVLRKAARDLDTATYRICKANDLSVSDVSYIVTGRRQLTNGMLPRLAKAFKVEAKLLEQARLKDIENDALDIYYHAKRFY